jgi:ABC-type multidrug transport system fused ATPase/permease subunit
VKLFDAARQIYGVLALRERRQVVVLLLLMLLDGLVEMIGVASIMPFMAVVVDPQLVFTQPQLRFTYERLGFSSVNTYIAWLGVAVLGVLAFANGLGAYTRWVHYKVAASSSHEIATRLLRGYASRPYEFFLNRHSTDMSKHVLNEVAQFVNNMLVPALDVIARAIVIVLIFGLLMTVNAELAIAAAAIIAGFYTVIYALVKRVIRRMGNERMEMLNRRFKTSAELLTGIKPVKIQDREDHFASRFESASERFAALTSRYQAISELPRHLVELVAFGGVISLVVYLIVSGRPFESIVPLLSLYAFAAYRLLPAAQRLYGSATNLRYHFNIVGELARDLGDIPEPLPARTCKPTPLRKGIELRGLSFRYLASPDTVVREVNLTIPAGTQVAFVGPTGSGKSTLVDLLTGLLSPTAGEILIDGQPLTRDTAPAWRATVGYVPQDVFLIDDTIEHNIAFGQPEAEIDRDLVRRVAAVSHIATFIETELPQQYQTLVGERGVRLSGGQRQRIGLARALYRDPSVLILDEATSALDGITEREVMEAIAAIPRGLTAIMIAHRLTTVRHCDRIFLIEAGRVTAEGSYQELVTENVVFQQMARLTT